MPVQPGGNQNIDMLDGLQKQIGQTVQTIQTGQPQKPDGTPITDPAELKAYYARLRQEGNVVEGLGDKIEDLGQERAEQTQELGHIAPMAPLAPMASKFFDLKTAQGMPGPMNEIVQPDLGQGGGQMGGMGADPVNGQLPDQTEQESDHSAGLPEQFSSPEHVKQVLLSIGNAAEAAHLFMDRFSNDNSVIQDPDSPGRQSNSEDAIRDPLNEFFSPQPDPSKEQKVQNDVANFIFNDVLPDSAKNTPLNKEPGEVPADFQSQIKTHVASLVTETNEIIKKLAQQHAKTAKSKGAFNLKKEAQHKSLQNVMMFGPEQVRYDEFTRQPISNWHLVERNKGFGLKIDDICDIDFEAIWRGTVMDKYDVNYIERRFEVDKNVPETSNMQLKPGQLRKPTLPEYGVIEGRLETDRGNKKDVFNWAKEASAKLAKNKDPENFHACGKCLLSKPCTCGKKAQMVDPIKRSLPYNASESKKKVTEAQSEGGVAGKQNIQPATTELPKLDGDVKPKQQQRWCPICFSKMRNALGAGGAGGKNPNECPSCKAIVPTPLMTDPQMGQVQKGEQQKPQHGNPTAIQPGTNLSSFGGIFYDADTNKFIVAKKKKDPIKEEVDDDQEEFEDYEEAEKFFQSQMGQMKPIMPQPQGGMGAPAPQQMPPAIQGGDDVDECDVPLAPGAKLDKKKLQIHNSMQSLAIDE